MFLRRAFDPAETLDLAVRSLRLLGGIVLLWAALGTMTMILRFRMVDLSDDVDDDALAAFAASTAPYVAGGSLLLVFAHYLRRRRTWAAVAATAVVTVMFVTSAFALLGMIVYMLGEYDTLFMLVPIVFAAALVYALGQLTYHLTRTHDAIRRLDREEFGGFEPIVATPTTPSPLPITTAPLHSHGGPDAPARER